MKRSECITIPRNFTPRDYQEQVFQALDGEEGKPSTKVNRVMLNWHRRAGKDKLCWCYMIKQAAQVPGNYFYIFPTATDAKRALWRNVDKQGFRLVDHIPAEFIERFLTNEMFIEYKNGSTIQIVGFDKNPDSIRGVACKGVVYSEFAYSDPEAYKVMVPSIRESEGWAIINSTPNGRNHFYDRWKAVSDSSRWYCSTLQTMWPDRPGYSGLLTPEDLKIIQEEEGYSQDDMEREFGASFSTGAKGAIYAEFLDAAYKADRIGDYIYDDTLPVNTYWDLGVKAYSACWFGQPRGNTVNFIDYWEDVESGTNDLARMLRDKGYDYGIHYLPHDADRNVQHQEIETIEQNLIISLRAFGVSGETIVNVKTPSVQTSITQVRKRFPLYRFDKHTCAEGLNHLELYHYVYDKRKKTFSSTPHPDEHSHCADALRMEAEGGDQSSGYQGPLTMSAIFKDDICE